MSVSHLLIVDDIAKNIQVAASVLKNEECKISFAQSGEKALEILAKEKIDLVLLDVMMPNMDGFEVCERIRENPDFKNIPVIFLTAKTDTQSITRAFQLGGVDYISKPFNNDELLARVRTHLRLHNALEQIEDQNKLLQDTNTVKDKLFSIIAHDLRNPFNGLLVLSDILRTKFNSMRADDTANMIELIYQSSRDGYDLLENLLEWSRSQRNQIEFRPGTVNLNQLIQGNLQLLTAMAQSKKISLTTELKESIRLTADSHMLDTVIRNLITNAIKFTRAGGFVSITAEEKEQQVVVAVTDSGIGIDEDELADFFSNIGTKSTQGTFNEKGTGLGLILCKEFITHHHGTIWVERPPMGGSRFIFSVPSCLSG